MTELEYLDCIREICAEEKAQRVMLFGSRARGDARPYSDFDIAVWGLPSVWGIRDRLDDLPTLYSADVVNMETCTNNVLRREVEEHGILI